MRQECYCLSFSAGWELSPTLMDLYDTVFYRLILRQSTEPFMLLCLCPLIETRWFRQHNTHSLPPPNSAKLDFVFSRNRCTISELSIVLQGSSSSLCVESVTSFQCLLSDPLRTSWTLVCPLEGSRAFLSLSQFRG